MPKLVRFSERDGLHVLALPVLRMWDFVDPTQRAQCYADNDETYCAGADDLRACRCANLKYYLECGEPFPTC